MKVLFVYPNSAGYTRIPMGITILITCLKKAGHQVGLFDTSFFKLRKKTDDQVREDLAQVKKTDLSQYGVTFEHISKEEMFDRFRKKIDEEKPDIIAFSVNEELMEHACELAENAKQYTDISILFGGIGVTTVPDEVIGHSFVDMICVGEGEEALVELADTMDAHGDISKIKNLWVKKNGAIIKNELRPIVDVDALPFVDFDEFSEKHIYRPFDGKVYRMVMYDMIRGCPYKCSYCDNHILQELYQGKGKYIRKKSIKRAIDELLYLRDKYDVSLFFFIDDDFCVQSETEMISFLKEYKEKIDVPFVVQGRPNMVSLKKLQAIKDAGCLTICMSIESGSARVREKVMNRHLTNEVIVNAFQMAKHVGLKANGQNIIGNPDETRDEIFETIEVNRKCQPYSISTNFMTPFKGTQIRKMSVERGYISPDFTVTTGIRGVPILDLPQFTKGELIRLQKVFSLYIKLPKILWPLISYCEKEYWGSKVIFKYLVNMMWGMTK